MKKCDNTTQIHVPVICAEDGNAVRVYCKQCGNLWRVGKDHNGAPEKELWGELFFEDAVQPPHPLYYQQHPETMSV